MGRELLPLHLSKRKFTFEVSELICVVECERTLFPVSLLEVYSPVVGPNIFPLVVLLKLVNAAKQFLSCLC